MSEHLVSIRHQHTESLRLFKNQIPRELQNKNKQTTKQNQFGDLVFFMDRRVITYYSRVVKLSSLNTPKTVHDDTRELFDFKG